ncbi:hypothetical protein [Devosia sp. Naph2]|uniref:hypothetical protein n=1 Tax=Devosia polycyclovorans TaxID=3345148 RepID=UPI0035CF3ADB
MSKKKDTLLTVAVGGAIPAGHKLQLTSAQADARRHLLVTDAKEKDAFSWKGDGRRAFTTAGPTYFKAGEQLAIDSDLDRGLEIMFGIADSGSEEAKPVKDAGGKKPTRAELAKAFEEGKAEGKADAASELDTKLADAKKEGRAEMLAEIEQRNALFEALETAQAAQESLASDADNAAKAAAQKAVDDAQAAIDALKPLEA